MDGFWVGWSVGRLFGCDILSMTTGCFSVLLFAKNLICWLIACHRDALIKSYLELARVVFASNSFRRKKRGKYILLTNIIDELIRYFKIGIYSYTFTYMPTLCVYAYIRLHIFFINHNFLWYIMLRSAMHLPFNREWNK